jgi:thiol:disulfide interchange protein DsbD
MKHSFIWLRALCAVAALATAFCGMARADDFLPPEQAFVLKAELVDARTVSLHWTMPPGYHLYRERLSFSGDGVQAPVLPAGVRKFDENFGKEMETYYGSLALKVPLNASAPLTLTVGYQGCADAGLCYPPVNAALSINPAAPGPLAVGAAAPPAQAALSTAGAPAANEDDTSLAQRTLQSGSPWRIGGAFLIFGLLLSFTPCVLPMVPILSSIIVGDAGVTRKRGLLLAVAYSLGMALVYTALGVAAGLAGEGLAGALQKPWLLLTFGALLVALALSMFDVYQLQLPGALQSRLSESSGRRSGGKLAGVFAMGALSALIVGPCVAGPLAGALLYISQTGNAFAGGWALFAMAAGMSVPLLLTGVSAGSLLPRAGAWMNNVKKVFGLLLIATAIWMISPVLPVTVLMVLWGALGILCAVFLRVGEAIPQGAGLGAYTAKALGVVLLLSGLFELVGAASSGHDPLQPLAHLRGGAGTSDSAVGAATASHGGPRFTRIKTVAELDQALAATDKPVMLDFYADWCVACKEMERMTFPEAGVRATMQGMQLLQVDVTANNEHDKALMKRFQLFGPPGIILFDAQGKEVSQARIIGFMPPARFVEQLQRAVTSG